jgi:tetratricopeptide (TPR) repeat protein
MTKKKKIVFMVIGVVLLVAAIGFGLYLYVFKGQDVTLKTPQQPAQSESTKNAVKASELNNNQINQQSISDEARKQAEDLAVKSLETAKSDEEKYDAYIAIASVCVTKVDYGCAADNYKKAADIKQGVYSTTATAAEYAQKAGLKQQALEYYKKALPLIDAKWIEADDMKSFVNGKIKELSS